MHMLESQGWKALGHYSIPFVPPLIFRLRLREVKQPAECHSAYWCLLDSAYCGGNDRSHLGFQKHPG